MPIGMISSLASALAASAAAASGPSLAASLASTALASGASTLGSNLANRALKPGSPGGGGGGGIGISPRPRGLGVEPPFPQQQPNFLQGLGNFLGKIQPTIGFSSGGFSGSIGPSRDRRLRQQLKLLQEDGLFSELFGGGSGAFGSDLNPLAMSQMR